MEKLNSEQLTKKVQDVKESEKQFLGGGKLKESMYKMGAAIMDSKVVKNVTSAAITAALAALPAMALAGINYSVVEAIKMMPSLGGKIAVGTWLGAIALATDGVMVLGGYFKAKELFEGVNDIFDYEADSLRNKAEALAEQRKASEGKTETVANQAETKTTEAKATSKPKVSKSQSDVAKQTLLKNKQMARA